MLQVGIVIIEQKLCNCGSDTITLIPYRVACARYLSVVCPSEVNHRVIDIISTDNWVQAAGDD